MRCMNREASSLDVDRSSKNASAKRFYRIAFRAAGAIAVLILLVLIVPKVFPDRQPADFRIEGPTLVITNKSGRELWRFETGLEALEPEGFFRSRFQHKRPIEAESGTAWQAPLLI